MGTGRTLTELGINDENFRKMTEHADKVNYLRNAFVPLTVEDIVEIYKACL